MKQSKKEESVNSLEKLLVSTGKTLKDKKESFTQILLVVLIVILAFVFLRTYLIGKPRRAQGAIDEAYYNSTVMFSLNPAPYQALSGQLTKGNDGAEVRILLGEAFLKKGQMEVTEKKGASEAKKTTADVIAMNPEATFNDAIKEFEEVINAQMPSDPLLLARALYDCGAAYENLAAITAGDDEVAVKLDAATSQYQMILEKAGQTAFAPQARLRIDALADPLTLAFYKKAANDYVTMPAPELETPAESILSENAEDLTPTDTPITGDGEFQLDQKATPVENATPTEEATPVENATPTEEPAPTENATPTEEAAPEA